ncbi:hypothetical protein ACFQBQ_13830 [Granulicella cerasi]|uniref:DUF5666 domain-containing protein n=1 Tax=Granulicella cerasi TaxID=741063 RepID=A0ABW1ZD70_9BACT|nr:hypothetical protein [Granulicella cerasi]
MPTLSIALLCSAVPAAIRAQDAPPAGQRGGGMFAGMQRAQGELVAVDGKTLTVKEQDGSKVLIVTTDNTRIMRGSGAGMMGGGGMGPGGGGMRGNMQQATLTDLKPGDGITAAGQFDDHKALHAMFVMDVDGAALAAMKANLGKTYIVGKVQSVDLDNAKMTVKRSDGVEQTILFDESTSFRRGQRMRMSGGAGGGTPQQPTFESITLADVKVGDNVSGKGQLKGGTFVPAELTVMTPPPHGDRPNMPGAPEYK